jgi:hypothetical protein
MADSQLALGPPPFAVADLGRLSFRLGMRWWRIDRTIASTALSQSLEEVMQARSWLVRVEARGRLRDHPKQGWRVAAQVERPDQQSLQVNSFGVFDPATLHPAGGRTWGFDAVWQYEWRPAWRLCAGAGFNRWRIGASASQLVTRAGVPVAVATYPGSTQQLKGLQLSIVHDL